MDTGCLSALADARKGPFARQERLQLRDEAMKVVGRLPVVQVLPIIQLVDGEPLRDGLVKEAVLRQNVVAAVKFLRQIHPVVLRKYPIVQLITPHEKHVNRAVAVVADLHPLGEGRAIRVFPVQGLGEGHEVLFREDRLIAALHDLRYGRYALQGLKPFPERGPRRREYQARQHRRRKERQNELFHDKLLVHTQHSFS